MNKYFDNDNLTFRRYSDLCNVHGYWQVVSIDQCVSLNYSHNESYTMSETYTETDECISGPPSKKKKIYKQKYNRQWEKEMKWLAPVKTNPHKAFCKLCSKVLIAGHSELKKHEKTKVHTQQQSYCCISHSIHF